MIIKELTLHNFGVYANTNTFTFNSNRPIVLIGGKNGRGKTTVLEAVLLSLYGSNSFSYKESKYSSYSKYLLSYVNEADGTKDSYVEMSFVLDGTSKDIITIKRSWSGNKNVAKEKIHVKKNGIDDDFLTNNWSMYIENILPSALSSFFFFDGEKIAELAADKTNRNMTNSIKALLGVTVLENLKNDIKRIISTIGNSDSNKLAEELEELREKKNNAENELLNIDQRIDDLNQKKVEIEKKIEQQHIAFLKKGGDIASKRQDLFTELSDLKSKLYSIDESLVSLAASELPLNLVSGILCSINEEAEQELESMQLSNSVKIINSFYQEYSSNQKKQSATIKKFIDFINEKEKNNEKQVLYCLSDSAYYQIQNLLSSRLDDSIKTLEDTVVLKYKTLERIDDIQNYLSIEIDEVAINRINKKIKSLEAEKENLEAKIEVLEKERVHFNGECIKATSEFNKYVEGFIKELDSNEDNNRTIKYAYLAIKLLDEFQKRVQIDKIKDLAQVMTDRYKLLANKGNLISCIEIDPVTLEFKYINTNGTEVQKEKLSAGEKQLMVIAMLWALAICSKKKLPVIIDTPLSRLDNEHRLSLINTYFPNVSEQTIILSTDSEVDEKYYKLMSENVGDTFTLIYDDDKQQSTIKSGYYFSGE